jgi:hypothetical protein
MDIKYIGMDVHKEAIAIAVMNGEGKLVMESIIETKLACEFQKNRTARQLPAAGRIGSYQLLFSVMNSGFRS